MIFLSSFLFPFVFLLALPPSRHHTYAAGILAEQFPFTLQRKEGIVEAQNPYSTPRAKVTGAPTAYGEIKVFSAKGRIGRVRYIGYSVGMTMLIGFVLGIVAALMGKIAGPNLTAIVVVASYVAIFVMIMLLTIQRAHDFNASGWLALLAIIPLVNLIFWFIPGTDGENRFGPQTRPNGTGAVVLALILPLVFIVGIVAAIALPAYQQYVKRAGTTQGQ